MLKCYQCGELTPASDGPLCWVCREKQQRGQSTGQQQQADQVKFQKALLKSAEEQARQTARMRWMMAGLALIILSLLLFGGVVIVQQPAP